MKSNSYVKTKSFSKGLLIVSMILFLCMLLVDIPSVKADNQVLGTFKANSCINLVQTCDNCTFINFTLVNPNSTIILFNIPMSKSGTFFNYTFCDFSLIGQYVYNTVGDPNGIITTQPVNLFITPTGNSFSISQAVTYVLMFIVSLLIFLGLLIVGIALPVKNKTDEMTGYVLAVSNLKYLKLFCLALSYVVLMFISYFAWQMTYAYLDFPFLSSIFQFMFFALAVALLPLFIVGVFFTIANAVRDSKLTDYLSRGLSTKDLS